MARKLRKRLGQLRRNVGLSTRNIFEARAADLQIRPRPGHKLVQFRFGDERDLDRLSRVHDYDDQDKSFAMDRLARGDKLVLGFLEDQVVTYTWVMFGQMELHPGRFLALDPEVVCPYKTFVIATERRTGIPQETTRFISQYLLDQGLDRLLIWINPDNHISERLHRKLGFELTGKVYTLQLFRWRFSHYRRNGHRLD